MVTAALEEIFTRAYCTVIFVLQVEQSGNCAVIFALLVEYEGTLFSYLGNKQNKSIAKIKSDSNPSFRLSRGSNLFW